MIPKLLLDMDGVISDWHRGIAEHHNIPFNWPHPGDWSVTRNLGLGDQQLWKGVDRKFWANLPKSEYADEVVELVKERFGINNVCIMTVYPTMYGYPVDQIDQCMLGKMDWLKKHFPELLTHFLIGPSKHFCASPNTTLLDDSDENCWMFRQNEGKAILFPRLWNSLHSTNDPIGYIESEL